MNPHLHKELKTAVPHKERRAGQKGLFEKLSNYEDMKTRKNIEMKK